VNKNVVILILSVAVAGGLGFAGGMKYQESKKTPLRAGGMAFQADRGQFQRGPGNGFRPVSGEIISSDDKSITVKLVDGSSKIVIVSESTVINKSAEGTRADLKTGERVMVFGTENTDGSVTAQNIQLNPVLRMMPTGTK